MSQDKEVGGFRTSPPKVVGPTYKERIAYGPGTEAYPPNWDGSMAFHTERSIKETEAHPSRTPKLKGGDGSVVPAPSCHCTGKSAKYAKTISGNMTKNRDIKP